MRGADNPGDRVGEQYRRAIGREHAERDARDGGHHGVGARVGGAPPRPLDGDRRGAVDLMAGDQPLHREGELRRRDRPVLLDLRRIVVRAEAAIERREHAVADPALAGEEGVANIAIALERAEGDHHPVAHSNPAGAGRPGDVSARALNKVPIWAGSIKRSRPP